MWARFRITFVRAARIPRHQTEIYSVRGEIVPIARVWQQICSCPGCVQMKQNSKTSKWNLNGWDLSRLGTVNETEWAYESKPYTEFKDLLCSYCLPGQVSRTAGQVIRTHLMSHTYLSYICVMMMYQRLDSVDVCMGITPIWFFHSWQWYLFFSFFICSLTGVGQSHIYNESLWKLLKRSQWVSRSDINI